MFCGFILNFYQLLALIAQENAKLASKLDKSNQHLFRLRLERR